MARVRVQNSIGGLSFDAVLKVDHSSKITLTKHPVEGGADITDHAYMEPCELSLEIGMSDAESGRRGGGGSRSVSAFQSLMKMQSRLKPVKVVTRLKTYSNMMISAIMSPDDFTTAHGLRATVLLEEIMTARTKTVKVATRSTADAQKVGQTSAGTKQPVSAQTAGTHQSVLMQAASKLGL